MALTRGVDGFHARPGRETPMHRGSRSLSAVAACAALLLLLGCTGGGESGEDTSPGRLEVLATWSGWEQDRFTEVLAAFERETGIAVSYSSAAHSLPHVLRQRQLAGRPPDVAFLPQPGLLQQLAASREISPLDGRTRALVEQHFPRSFVDLGSFEGDLYGVWFKAANKSLVWYDVASFERRGEVPPADLAGLLALARRLARDGTPAFAVSAASGWTLTDWFENLYVRTAGVTAYDALAAGRLPWTDASVVRTLELMSELLAPETVAGGVDQAVETDFEASVDDVAGRPSRAAMLVEGDFVAGVIRSGTSARLGVDVDVFPFPSGAELAPVVIGGGDVAVQLRRSPASARFLRYLATPEAAAVWARRGGFLSPNTSLDLMTYPDAITRTVARRLLEAGDGFRFDLSDLQPAEFGGSETQGLRAELRTFLRERSPETTARRLQNARASVGST